jgi:hypothetical protein
MMDLEGTLAEIMNKDNSETFNKSAHSLQAIVDNLLAHGTYGLAALKALIDAVQTRLDDGNAGLAAIKAVLDILEGQVTDGTHGLAALKSIVDGLEARLTDGTSGLDALKALLDALESKLDKLAGEAPVSGSVTGNWESGTATSGESGADIVTIGANDTRYKLHSLLVSIHNFQTGGKVTIKLFMQVNGTEQKVYEEQFSKGTDLDGLWIVNGTVGIHEAIRVEAESNRAADNGVAVDYDYMLEAM